MRLDHAELIISQAYPTPKMKSLVASSEFLSLLDALRQLSDFQ